MKCPTPCDECGEVVELDSLHFNTHLCDCPPMAGCSHGICQECYEDLVDDGTEDRP